VISAFEEKVVVVLFPRAILNNSSFTCNVVDCQGWRYAKFDVILGATDIAITALKLQESDAETDANTLTSGTDVVGTRYGTDNNDTGAASTLPAATDDNKVFSFFVDLRARKRYQLPTVTVGNGSTGAFVAVLCTLSRPENAPRLATQAGYAQRMVV
jgi:hypothetical protein